MNLHHFLYLQALAEGPQAHSASLTEIVNASSCIPQLKGADAEKWFTSVSYYRENLVSKDWLFDDALVRINDLLSEQHGARVSTAGIGLELRQALNEAAPIYRRFCWKKHRERNSAWIASVRQKLTLFGTSMATRLARVYEEEWPSRPILVDVVPYANWAGAYTTLNPNHTTISSIASDYQGYFALEMVFHEASHVFGVKVQAAIDSECKSQHVKAPRDLWHALLFYTAGEVTREELAKKGTTYVPYADQFGLYQKVPHWLEYRAAFETSWKPYLDGQGSFSEAIKAVVAFIAPQPKPISSSGASGLLQRMLSASPQAADHFAYNPKQCPHSLQLTNN